MLSIFRTNQFLVSVFLIPYAILLRFSVFLNTDLPDYSSEGGILSHLILEWLNGQEKLSVIVALIVVVFQAILINALVITHRLARDISLLPGMFYVLMASMIPSFLYLSPVLMANTFLIIALGELMATYKNPSSADRIFNVGFWIAVGSLFYFPFLVFIPLGIVGLNTLRALKLQEVFMLLIGCFVPYFLAFTVFFWYGDQVVFWNQQFTFSIGLKPYLFPNIWESYLQIGIVVLAILVVLFSFNRYLIKRNIQVQKKNTILFWTIFVVILTPFLMIGIRLEHLLVFAVPLGIFLSFNFQQMSRSTSESLHLLLLAFILFLQYKDLLLGI